MEVFLDDQPCPSEAGSVGEAIAEAAEAAERKGRFIVEVVVDGAAWTNEQLEADELVTATAAEVRLSSADPRQFVGQTFAQAGVALNEVRTIQNDAAAFLQTDDHEAAMERLGEAFAVWMSVQQAVVQGSQLLGLDLDTCTVNDRPVEEIVAGLGTRLQALHGQLESNDTVAVADTLLYDLPDVVDEWRELLATLQQLVEKA